MVSSTTEFSGHRKVVVFADEASPDGVGGVGPGIYCVFKSWPVASSRRMLRWSRPSFPDSYRKQAGSGFCFGNKTMKGAETHVEYV